MLWDVEIQPHEGQVDREAGRVLSEGRAVGAASLQTVRSARTFLVQGELTETEIRQAAEQLLVDPIAEQSCINSVSTNANGSTHTNGMQLLNVLYKPGVTDNVASSAKNALVDLGFNVEVVASCRKYWVNGDLSEADQQRLISKVLANDAIERVVIGPLKMDSIALGSPYEFDLQTVAIRGMSDEELTTLSRVGQLYLSLTEMQTIQKQFVELDRDPTDIELETVAQTWSEHCSHKTLAGRIHYRDEQRDLQFDNMLKETIFQATVDIREQLGDDDWCVSVFKDNAGIVKFDETQNVCIKVETHNHPSALEPYGGANTGMGGVIRDPLGTGMGAKPVCNTDVFCFAPPETPQESLPPGVLHPKAVAKGVVSGVRDYGNRMGIPTVNGAVFFDERYLGNPLVYCGNVAMIPIDQCEKHMTPGDLIVAVGGRTGRDGIHGATFSSAELTDESESLSGGAVQIGNAITEKMVMDVILEARDRGLYSSITDCGAGGFSSAVGEMGEETGAEVWLEKCPLKYEGLTYTEIWISEAQERMVLAVPPEHWDAFQTLCESEGVEASVIGKFTDTHRLVLKYHDEQVADLAMSFLHDGRPPVIRDAVYQPPTVLAKKTTAAETSPQNHNDVVCDILGSLNVCSKEWIIRQYDHEVQAGSVVKPLVGVNNDGPSDAAVVRPILTSDRGLVVSNGMNPRYGDLDPYWMAASAIDEAIRNCVAVGADPQRIAILDNFCWGNTEKPEVLGSVVRAALACHKFAVAYRTPFVSGKDSLNNEFSYDDADGNRQTVAIPPSLLITALGQINDVSQAVTMDLKSSGNLLYQIGVTKNELGGSHYEKVTGQLGGAVPQVDTELSIPIFAAVHQAISQRLLRSCHDLSEGGLAVAVAEMAFAGGFGVTIDLSALVTASEVAAAISEATLLTEEAILFSESNSRFVVEVTPENQAAFESCFANVPLTFLGTVTETPTVQIANGDNAPLINATNTTLKTAWQQPLNWD